MIEIIDEAGNIHGPFTSREEALQVASDRGLGEQQDNSEMIARMDGTSG